MTERVGLWLATLQAWKHRAQVSVGVAILAALLFAAPVSAHGAYTPPWPWIALADCESGDGDGRPPYHADWDYNGYFDGGLQFLPSTWDIARRKPEVYRVAWRYPYAYMAPAWVQVRVARNWLRYTSWAQWPACSRKLGLR